MDEEQLVKRCWTHCERRYDVTLEQCFWDALEEMARLYKKSVPNLVLVAESRRAGPLASVLRIFVLEHQQSLLMPWKISTPSVQVH